MTPSCLAGVFSTARCGMKTFARGTEEMMQPCLIHLHVISLVAHTPSFIQVRPERHAAFPLRVRCRSAKG